MSYTIDLLDSGNIIWKVARFWQDKIPDGSCIDVEDLVQECWSIEPKTRETYDGSVKFTTYLWKAANWRCKNILTTEAYSADIKMDMADEEMLFADEMGRPDSQYETCEVLNEILKSSSQEFIEMITIGIPRDLFIQARRHMRLKRHARGWNAKDGKFFIPKAMMESFFDVNLKKLSAQYYSYIES